MDGDGRRFREFIEHDALDIFMPNSMYNGGMTETMRTEGHTALVHTAAASNLGQMLNKICLKDDISLVNIVRNTEQAAILRKIGAKHVIDSSSATLVDELTAALVETGATIAFDAIGCSGKLPAATPISTPNKS